MRNSIVKGREQRATAVCAFVSGAEVENIYWRGGLPRQEFKEVGRAYIITLYKMLNILELVLVMRK